MNKKSLIAGLVISIVLSGMTFFSTEPTVAEQQKELPREQNFIAGNTIDGPVITLNPYIPQSQSVKMAIYETLAYPDQFSGELKPMLAENWGWVDDYTFQIEIREEAHWWNGDPITAEDVVFSLKTQADESITGQFTSFLKPVKSYEIVNEKTVRLNIGEDYSPRTPRVLGILGNDIPIVPKDRWSALIDRQGKENVAVMRNDDLDEINGSGPYKPIIDNPSKTVFKRVKDYWGKEIGWYYSPKFFTVVWMGGGEAVITALGGHELDYSQVGHLPGEWIKARKDYLTTWNIDAERKSDMFFSVAEFRTITPNMANPVLRQRWLRKALAYALDQVKIGETAYDDQGSPLAPGYLHSDWTNYEDLINKDVLKGTFETSEKTGILNIKYDPKKAVEILKEHCEGSIEEGWTITDPVGNPELKGKKLGPWTVQAVNGWSLTMSEAKMTAKYFREIGIPAEPAYYDYGQFSDRWTNNNFDWSWRMDPIFFGVNKVRKTYMQNLVMERSLWTGSGIDYQKYWTENYPATENTADEVKSLVEKLWRTKAMSEEFVQTVKEIQSIVIPQFPSIPMWSRGNPTTMLTDYWVNYPKAEDPYEHNLSEGYMFRYITWRHIRSTKIETVSFSLSPGEVKSGETVEAEITLRNTGSQDHLYPLYIRKGSAKPGPGPEIIAHKGPIVPAGETKTVTLEFAIEKPGSYTITVDDWRIHEFDPGRPKEKTLIVEAKAPAAPSISVGNLMLDKYFARPGDTVTVSSEVTNAGEASGTKTVKLLVNGKEEDSQDVTLGAGESTTVDFTVSKAEEGSYTIEVGELSKTLTVRKRVEIPAGLKESVDLAVRMAENAMNSATIAGDRAQSALDAAEAAQSAAEDASATASDAVTAAEDAKDSADAAKTAAQKARDAAKDVEGGASTTMVVASMVITIIVVLAGVYVITGRRAT